jgi:hypothetical protein
MQRISYAMPNYPEVYGHICPNHHSKSKKSSRRIPSRILTFLLIIYELVKMTYVTTVPDPDPELNNFDFAKPKLFFKNISRYAATSTYIHI